MGSRISTTLWQGRAMGMQRPVPNPVRPAVPGSGAADKRNAACYTAALEAAHTDRNEIATWRCLHLSQPNCGLGYGNGAAIRSAAHDAAGEQKAGRR